MIIDILVLAVLLISVLISLFRGFIREVLTIFGLAGAAFAAFYIGPAIEPSIASFLIDPNAEVEQKLFGVIPFSLLATLVAYGGVFVVFMVGLSILSHVLSEGAEKIGLGSVDRSLGAVFGFVRGALLIGLFYLPFYYFMSGDEKESWFSKSYSYPYLEWTASFIDDFIPNTTKLEDKAVEGIAEEGKQNIERMIREAQPKRNGGEPEAPTPAYDDEQRKSMENLIDGVNK